MQALCQVLLPSLFYFIFITLWTRYSSYFIDDMTEAHFNCPRWPWLKIAELRLQNRSSPSFVEITNRHNICKLFSTVSPQWIVLLFLLVLLPTSGSGLPQDPSPNSLTFSNTKAFNQDHVWAPLIPWAEHIMGKNKKKTLQKNGKVMAITLIKYTQHNKEN